jgi:hypothetical protein
MIWLTWRQYRLHVAVVYSALLAFAAALLLTGPHLADVYAEDAKTFLDWVGAQRADRNIYTVGTVAGFVVPALIGAFWGAPLIARELEAGTHRLVWTQGITRGRWLATKLGFGLLGAVTATGVMSLGLTWWAHPVDKAVNGTGDSSRTSSIFQVVRLSPEVFASRGLAPIGYAAFAFALGVLAGAVIRRTVPAMAVVLAAYVVLQIVMPIWVRPHLVEPVTDVVTISRDNLHGIGGRPGHIERLDVEGAPDGSWALSSQTVDAQGVPVTELPSWLPDCLPSPGQERGDAGTQLQACFDRLTDAGYRQKVEFHPTSHYWALQWRETGVLLGGAALMTGACFWRVRRLS